MELPMTFADFAITEARFRKHFRQVPRDAWNDKMLPLAEFLTLSEDDRVDKFPYIWAIDRQQSLNRVMVDSTIVDSCEERRDFWILLKDLAASPTDKSTSTAEIEQKVRVEVVNKIAQGLMKMASNGNASESLTLLTSESIPSEPAPSANGNAGPAMAPWLETQECSSCNECIKINSKIFAYNEDNKAFIKDAEAGPFEDIVKAAEKCTARVIHPGLPKDTEMKDYDKWVKRAEKFN